MIYYLDQLNWRLKSVCLNLGCIINGVITSIAQLSKIINDGRLEMW